MNRSIFTFKTFITVAIGLGGKESRALEHNTQNEGPAHSKTSGSMKHSFGLGRAVTS